MKLDETKAEIAAEVEGLKEKPSYTYPTLQKGPRTKTLPRRAHKDADGLTPRKKLFVLEYMKDFDTQQAALRAGYTPSSALVANKLLREPAVMAVVDRYMAQIEKKYVIDAPTILKELARLAMSDPRTLFTPEGNVKPVTQWSADDAACIAQVDIVKRNIAAGDGKTDEILKIRFWDKPKTLEILAKHLGLLTERLEIRGDAELVERLAGARRRLAVQVVEEG